MSRAASGSKSAAPKRVAAVDLVKGLEQRLSVSNVTMTLHALGEKLESRRGETIVELSRLVAPASGAMDSVRLNAALLLLYFDQPSAARVLVELFERPDEALRYQAGWAVRGRHLPALESGIEQLDLGPRLLATLADPRGPGFEDAVFLCWRLRIHGVRGRFLELATDDRVQDPSWIVSQLAEEPREPVVLEIAERLLGSLPPGANESWLLEALGSFASQAEPALADRAVMVLLAFARPLLARRDNDSANRLRWALDGIASRPSHPMVEPFLEDVLRSKTESWVKGSALQALARVRGPSMVPRLLELRDRAELKEDAGGAILLVANQREPARLARELQEVARNGGRADLLAVVVKVLLEVTGPSARQAARALAGHLDPCARMDVLWRLDRRTPGGAARLLVQARVIKRPAPEVLAAIDDAWRSHGSGHRAVLDLLQRAGVMSSNAEPGSAVALYTTDRSPVHICGDEAAIRKAAASLFLPLADFRHDSAT